jgi:hypothetical protein
MTLFTIEPAFFMIANADLVRLNGVFGAPLFYIVVRGECFGLAAKAILSLTDRSRLAISAAPSHFPL